MIGEKMGNNDKNRKSEEKEPKKRSKEHKRAEEIQKNSRQRYKSHSRKTKQKGEYKHKTPYDQSPKYVFNEKQRRHLSMINKRKNKAAVNYIEKNKFFRMSLNKQKKNAMFILADQNDLLTIKKVLHSDAGSKARYQRQLQNGRRKQKLKLNAQKNKNNFIGDERRAPVLAKKRSKKIPGLLGDRKLNVMYLSQDVEKLEKNETKDVYGDKVHGALSRTHNGETIVKILEKRDEKIENRIRTEKKLNKLKRLANLKKKDSNSSSSNKSSHRKIEKKDFKIKNNGSSGLSKIVNYKERRANKVREAYNPKLRGKGRKKNRSKSSKSNSREGKKTVPKKTETKRRRGKSDKDEEKTTRNESMSKSMVPKRSRVYLGGNSRKRNESMEQKAEDTGNFMAIVRSKKEDAFCKQKGFGYLTKLNFMRDFCFKINFSNNMVVRPSKTEKKIHYKYFLTRGNNSILLRQAFERRWWWTSTTNPQDVDINFIWIQKFNRDVFHAQPSRTRTFEKIEPQNVPDGEGNFDKNKDRFRYLHSKFLTDSDVNRIERHQLKKFGKTYEMKMSSYNDKYKNVLERDLDIIYTPETLTLQNKFYGQYHLGFKKSLYYNMKSYYSLIGQEVSDYLPLTFHIDNLESPSFLEFQEHYVKSTNRVKQELGADLDYNDKEVARKLQEKKDIWILKPGEGTCGGSGIEVKQSLTDIKQYIKDSLQTKHTIIVQRYIKNPLLFKGRKFDIRCHCLVTSMNGKIKAYWYSEGYLRTASEVFKVNNLDIKASHITNDSIQKHSKNYGKNEHGNKLTFKQLNEYLNQNHRLAKDNPDLFYSVIYPQIKNIARDCFRGVYSKLNPKGKFPNFQLFGMDYIIDDDCRAWLIETNGNPGLSQCHNFHLEKILVKMMEHMVQIAVDPLFPPPLSNRALSFKRVGFSENILKDNLFELFFDEERDGIQLEELEELKKIEKRMYGL